MELPGKVVVVTGGAQGIGRAYSQAMLQRGAKVAFFDVNEKEGEKTLAEFAIRFGSDQARFLAVDVRNDVMFRSAWMKVIEEFGRVDILVNNAGIVEEAEWQKCVDVNFCGVIRGTLLAVEHMRKDKGGAGGLVVNISSIAGFLPFDIFPTYCGTKHAIIGFTRSWADFSAERNLGVRINVLCPGFTDTPILIPHGNTLDDEKIIAIKKAVTNDLMTVEFMSDALVRLICEENMNGSVMVVTKRDGVQYKEFEKFQG